MVDMAVPRISTCSSKTPSGFWECSQVSMWEEKRMYKMTLDWSHFPAMLMLLFLSFHEHFFMNAFFFFSGRWGNCQLCSVFLCTSNPHHTLGSTECHHW